MSEKRLFFLLNQAQHKMLKFSDKYFSENIGVTSAQMAALFFLDKNDGCLLKELSRGIKLNNSAVTGLVGRMEKAGLAERKQCENDGRSFRVYLTDKSRDALIKAYPLLEKSNRIMTENFNKEEIKTVLKFLNHIVDFKEEELLFEETIEKRS